MKRLLALVLTLVLLLPAFAFADGVVNVFNWDEYIDQEVIKQFTDETGIKVNYIIFTTNEDMMLSATGNPSWTIEELAVDDNGDGSYWVYADGYKTTVSFENEENSDGMITFTNAHVRLAFNVTKEGKDIKIGNKVIEPDKQIGPDHIEVATATYNSSTDASYYQAVLDALCGD